MLKEQTLNTSSSIIDFVHGQIAAEYKSLFNTAMVDLEEFNKGESKFFWNFLLRLGLKVDQRFFVDFKLNDGFQLVDQYGRLTFFSMNIAKLLKFDIDYVLNTPFEELFERDMFTTNRIMDTFVKMMSADEKSVFDLAGIPKHIVKQRGFPNDSYSVAFKKAYPVYSPETGFYGFVLRLDVSPISN